MKKDILLLAKKSCGFQCCFAFPPLRCFPAERDPVSPLHGISSEPILPAVLGMGLPRGGSEGTGQRQKGTLKLCQRVLLSSTEQAGRKRNFHKAVS